MRKRDLILAIVVANLITTAIWLLVASVWFAREDARISAVQAREQYRALTGKSDTPGSIP
jgi:hypothetical protein